MAATPVDAPDGDDPAPAAARTAAGPPLPDTPTPPAVRAFAAGRPLRPVWRNELGGLTYEVSDPAGRSFVKWAPAGCGLDLAAEAVRLEWAAPFTPVPGVLAHRAAADGYWLATAGLPGESAVSARWLAEPATAVAAIGEGLRALHEALPVRTCPFSWRTEDRLATVRSLAAAGWHDPGRWHREHAHLPVDAALARLAEPPPVDRLVVCHGDPCSPNTLIGEDGRWTGHVDVGALGVADRWADISVAAWSVAWNYGPGWDATFFAAYGIAPDPDRMAYYRLLWDLGP